MRKGSHHSESTKQLISMKLKQKYAQGWAPRLGKRHSDETRKKISMSRKVRFVGENNLFYGKHHTEEARRRISEKKRGQYLVKPRLDATPDLAYILGVLKGDGCVYEHGRGADVKLVTKDYKNWGSTSIYMLRSITVEATNLYMYFIRSAEKRYESSLR